MVKSDPVLLYVLNDAAWAYMRGRSLSGPVIERLVASARDRRFADHASWMAHLEDLGITALRVNPDPVRVATEGAIWGAITEHGLLEDTVILSDDAGQFSVGRHALCWVHAERLIHKLDACHAKPNAAKRSGSNCGSGGSTPI